MSKSKPTQLDVIHDLKRQIKDRDDTIKKLYRKLNNELKAEKHAEKKSKKTEPEKDAKENSCLECPKGKLKTTDLGARKLISCSDCKYRKTTK